MKKMIKILTIVITVFLGIDCVQAETDSLFAPATGGTCSLSSSDSDICQYSCEVSREMKTGQQVYAKFDYTVEFKDGKLQQNITKYSADGTGFPAYNKDIVEDVRDILPSGIDAFLGLFNFQNFQIDSSNSIKFYYFFAGVERTDNVPASNYFVVDGSLKCRGISPRVEPVTLFDDNIIVGFSRDVINGAMNLLNVDSRLPENTSRIVKTKISILRNAESESTGDITIDTSSACGLLGGEDSNTVRIIKQIYGYIKIIIPILIIVLSISDFIKVIGTGKDDDMKKSIKKFTIRIIVAIVFILVPILISLFIKVSGISSQYSGLNDGLKAIFCILE